MTKRWNMIKDEFNKNSLLFPDVLESSEEGERRRFCLARSSNCPDPSSDGHVEPTLNITVSHSSSRNFSVQKTHFTSRLITIKQLPVLYPPTFLPQPRYLNELSRSRPQACRATLISEQLSLSCGLTLRICDSSTRRRHMWSRPITARTRHEWLQTDANMRLGLRNKE
jgi:hypothetical protein